MTGYVPIESGPVKLWVTSDALQTPEGVRFRITGRQAFELANAAHALPPTAKIADLIWEQADVRIPFHAADVVKQTDEQQSAAIDNLIAGRAGLVSSVGKDWVLSKKATAARAVNYGGHTTAKAKKNGPWPAQTTDARVWQQPGTAHNWDHADYSQLLRLVSRNAEVDGVPVDLVDVLTDPSLAHWVTDEGAWSLGQLQTAQASDVHPVAYNDEGAPTPQPAATLINAAGMMKHTDNAFRWALVLLAQKLGLEPDHIAIMISIESGFRPWAKNPKSGASGINQMLPSALEKAGIDPATFRTWTAAEQLPWVRKQYAPLAKLLAGAGVGDYYMANFLPAYVGSPGSLVLGVNPGNCRGKGFPTNRAAFPELAAETLDKAPSLTLGAVYCSNWGFDRKGDGAFTVGDVRALAEDISAAAASRPRVPFFPEELPSSSSAESGGSGLIALGVFALVAGGLLLRRVAA